MANQEHLDKLKQGVKAWNAWREKNPSIRIDLSGADLREANPEISDLAIADLRGANLDGVVLAGAILVGAFLDRASLCGADLTGVNLSSSSLSGANFYRAVLGGADLRYAVLDEANFSEAYLGDVDLFSAYLGDVNLNNATIGLTILGNVDLSDAKGLETVEHDGPSTIGIDTIFLSSGNIPHSFLRKAGIPEDVIEYLLPLAGKAIQFYSCFISYSTRDQAFADRLRADLQAKGVRCWLASEDMKGGRKVHEQINEQIRRHDKLLVVLSEASMNSEWVKTEIRLTRRQERQENRRKLFPVSLVPFDAIRDWEAFDADSGKDMGVEVREYFIPDFSNWKNHDAYQTAFDRLLRDLQADDAIDT